MRLINKTAKVLTIKDIDAGIIGSIYDSWNDKTDVTVPSTSATVTGFIDVFDSERVMLSTELGDVKKFKALNFIDTEYSITGREVGPFVISGANNIFSVKVGTSGFQSFTLPTGSAVTISQIVSSINLSATGFQAEESDRFFRSSNTDNVTGPYAVGDLGIGYGVRGPSIISGFLVIHSTSILTIGSGTANATLGFDAKDITRCK